MTSGNSLPVGTAVPGPWPGRELPHLEKENTVIVLKDNDFSPRKVGQSTRAIDRTPPAPVLQPIRTPLQKLRAQADIAEKEAHVLHESWSRRTDAMPAVGDELLYSQLRYAQGRADAFREAANLMGGAA